MKYLLLLALLAGCSCSEQPTTCTGFRYVAENCKDICLVPLADNTQVVALNHSCFKQCINRILDLRCP